MKSITGTTTHPRSPRRALPRLLALLLVLALLPAGSLASSVPNTMRVAFVSPADLELYPLRMADRDMLSILDLVYESPINIGDTRQPEAGLATSWEVLSNGRTWIFHFREGVYFHDGREMTAYDVAATMDAIKAIATDSSLPANEKGLYGGLVNVLKSWKADDKYTLTVQSEQSSYNVLYAMTFPVLQSQSLSQANPPGTGPYRVEYYNPGVEIWLAGNQNWYAAPPHINEIIGVWYPTASAALAAFDSEEVDIVMTRSPGASRYRGSGALQANSYDYSTQQLEVLMINNYVRKLSSVEMRQAIAYAVDVSLLSTNVYSGLVTTTDTLQSASSWLYNKTDDVMKYTYSTANVEKARKLLDELGWSNFNDKGYRFRKKESGEDEVLTMRLCYYDEAGTSLRKEAASQVAAMLEAIGISVQLVRYDFAGGVAKLKSGDYDLFLCAINFDVIPDPSFLFVSSAPGAMNYAYYNSKDMSDLCKGLSSEPEAEGYQMKWFEIQVKMSQDVPFVPLYWRNGVVITRYPYSSVRDIREFELLKSINQYK